MKKITLLLTLLMLVLVSAVNVAGQSVTTVRIWSWSQEQVEFFADMKELFEARNPGIKLEFETIVQDQYHTSLNLAFRGETAPDIFFYADIHAPELNEMGYLRPVTEFLTPELTERIPSEYISEGAGAFQGEVYGLPAGSYRVARPGYLYYNRNVMSQFDLDPDRPPQTWSELKEMSYYITENGNGEVFGLGVFARPANDLERGLVGLASTLGLGTEHFDFRQGRFGYDSEEWVKLYEYALELKDSFFPGFSTIDKSIGRVMFAQDRIAFYFDGIWMPSVWNEMGYDNIDYGVAPPPVPDSGRKGYHYLVPTAAPYWYMSSQTANPEVTWKVMEFMFSDEYQTEWVKRGFGYTPLNSVDNAVHTPDPKLREILTFADDISRLGVMPAMKNPEAGKVEGFSRARALGAKMIWEIMTSCLIQNAPASEFAARAKAYNEQVNEVFMEAVEDARRERIHVSLEDFIFADWDPMKDYIVD